MNSGDFWSRQGLSGSEPGSSVQAVPLVRWLAYWGAAALCSIMGAACAPGYPWQGAWVMGAAALFVGAFFLTQVCFGRGCLAMVLIAVAMPVFYTWALGWLVPAYIDRNEVNAVAALGVLTGMLAALGRSTLWALLVNLLGYWSVAGLMVFSSSGQPGHFAVLAGTGLIIPLTMVLTGGFGFGRQPGQARLQRAQHSLAWSFGVFVWGSLSLTGLCSPDLRSRLIGLVIGLAGAGAFWAAERGRRQGRR